MSTSTDRIDQLALVWLLVPRKKGGVGEFAKQLKNAANGADDQRRLAAESIARLRERGMIASGRGLALSDAGQRSALQALGISTLQPESTLRWAKKRLLLLSLDVTPTSKAMETAGKGAILASRVLARRHKIDRAMEGAASKVLAVLARRALGLDDKPATFSFDAVFPVMFLTAAEPDCDTAPVSGTVSLKLAERELPEFARIVTEAARTSATGRWHGAVFISHVWSTLRARGDVGITLEKFKRRLVEAHQKDLIELSRADLVDAMPAADVSASETTHSGARFHFVRLEQLAS